MRIRKHNNKDIVRQTTNEKETSNFKIITIRTINHHFPYNSTKYAAPAREKRAAVEDAKVQIKEQNRITHETNSV